jgi:hypothetical protein
LDWCGNNVAEPSGVGDKDHGGCRGYHCLHPDYSLAIAKRKEQGVILWGCPFRSLVPITPRVANLGYRAVLNDDVATRFENSEQSYTATCTPPLTGTPVEVTIPAGEYVSYQSQEIADAQALAQATEQAEAELVCEIPVELSIAFSSLTATPTLLGYSAYENENAGPIYKWRNRTFSGNAERRQGTCVDCPEGLLNFRSIGILSGSNTIDDDGIETIGATGIRTDSPVISPCSEPSEFQASYYIEDIRSAEPWGGQTFLRGAAYEVTLLTATMTGAECAGEAVTEKYFGVSVETISVPDTIEAAIARETPVEGGADCAVTGIVAATSARSSIPIGVGESTSVVMDLSIVGGLASTEYILTIVFKNYVDSTNVELAETTMDINITTDVNGEWADSVDIPQPESDRRRCYERYEIEISP